MLRGGVLYIMRIREIINRANRGVKVRSLHHTGMDASVMCRQERFELRRCDAVIVIVTVNANVTISTAIICIAMCCTKRALEYANPAQSVQSVSQLFSSTTATILDMGSSFQPVSISRIIAWSFYAPPPNLYAICRILCSHGQSGRYLPHSVLAMPGLKPVCTLFVVFCADQAWLEASLYAICRIPLL